MSYAQKAWRGFVVPVYGRLGFVSGKHDDVPSLHGFHDWARGLGFSLGEAFLDVPAFLFKFSLCCPGALLGVFHYNNLVRA